MICAWPGEPTFGGEEREVGRGASVDGHLSRPRQPGAQLLRVWFFGGLLDGIEESTTAFEPRIHDIGELRAERVAQAEEREVVVRGRQLALSQQHLLL